MSAIALSHTTTEWHTCSLYFVLFRFFSPYLYVCMFFFFFSLLPLVWWIKIYIISLAEIIKYSVICAMVVVQIWSERTDGDKRGRYREGPTWEIRFRFAGHYRRLRGEAEAVWPRGRRALPRPSRLRHCATEKLAVCAAFNFRLTLHTSHRCNKRLQSLKIKLINAFVIFVNVYYFNKRHMKCRKKFCRIARVGGSSSGQDKKAGDLF